MSQQRAMRHSWLCYHHSKFVLYCKPTQDILDAYLLSTLADAYACLDKKIWLKKLLLRKNPVSHALFWAHALPQDSKPREIDSLNITIASLYLSYCLSGWHVSSATTHDKYVSRMLWVGMLYCKPQTCWNRNRNLQKGRSIYKVSMEEVSTIFAVPSQKVLKLLKGHEVP